MSIFASVMQQPKPLYEILEYIQSTGTQFIDSGVKALKGYTSQIRFQATSIPTSGQYLESWIMSVYQSSSPWRCGISNSALNTSDGYTYSQSSPLKETTASGVCPANLDFSLVVFGQNESIGIQHVANSKYKLWYLKISDANGKPVRDYVPARRLADSAVGLYDRVEKKFYENAGTGAFAAGSATGEVVMSVSEPTLVTREVAALVARREKAINRNMSKVYRTVNGVVRQVFPDVLAVEKFIDGPRISDNLQFMLSGDGSGGRTPGAHSSVSNGIRISHNQCGGSMFITTEKVNVSNYSKLSARAIAYVNNSRTSMDFCVMLFKSMPADLNRRTFYNYYNWYFTGVGGTKLVEAASELIYPYNVGVPCSAMLDLSRIYGEYYIALEVTNNHNGSGDGSITIDSFMLE